MNDKAEASSSPPQSSLAPTGIRIASTLCWVVGVLSILAGVAVGIPQMESVGALPMVINAIAGAGVCAAGYLVRKQRKSGAYLIVAAWAFPTVVSLLAGGGAKPGNLLLLVALIGLVPNWKHLH